MNSTSSHGQLAYSLESETFFVFVGGSVGWKEQKCTCTKKRKRDVEEDTRETETHKTDTIKPENHMNKPEAKREDSTLTKVWSDVKRWLGFGEERDQSKKSR